MVLQNRLSILFHVFSFSTLGTGGREGNRIFSLDSMDFFVWPAHLSFSYAPSVTVLEARSDRAWSSLVVPRNCFTVGCWDGL